MTNADLVELLEDLTEPLTSPQIRAGKGRLKATTDLSDRNWITLVGFVAGHRPEPVDEPAWPAVADPLATGSGELVADLRPANVVTSGRKVGDKLELTGDLDGVVLP